MLSARPRAWRRARVTSRTAPKMAPRSKGISHDELISEKLDLDRGRRIRNKRMVLASFLNLPRDIEI